MAVTDVDILLECLRISQRGLNPAVAQEALDLFQRHTALEGQAGGSVPEDVRRNMAGDRTPGKNLLNFILYGLDGKPVVRRTAADEQSRTIVLPGSKVCPQ